VIVSGQPQRAATHWRRRVNPAEENLQEIILAESQGEGADVIVVAAPAHRALESALDLASIGGRINFFGGLPKDRPTIQLNANLVHYKELVITGTTASSTFDCWRAATIVSAGKVDLSRLVSARFPLEQAVDGFAAAESGRSLKVVLEP
jgi:L-iditol 2-dehydrogenase